jgi:hypothetical protein
MWFNIYCTPITNIVLQTSTLRIIRYDKHMSFIRQCETLKTS